MGGPASLTIRHDRSDRQAAEVACHKVRDDLNKLETKYSRHNANSLVSQINLSAGSSTPVEIDQETRASGVCQQLSQSDGLFDPTAGALNAVGICRKVVLIRPSDCRQPSRRWVGNMCNSVKPALSLPRKYRLDLGGIVKEFAVDMSVQKLRAAGFKPHRGAGRRCIRQRHQ